MNPSDKYELVVGLEVHAQLSTDSKLFCGDNTAFGAEPNTQISAISLAHPGTLPKLNKKAIELAIKLGIALHCDIEKNNYFARKNYFYPDLPKGYQISQHTAPICTNGFVTIKSADDKKNIQLNRIHIEEDAGKSIHDSDPFYTCIDLNRAGVALLEIVTEPVIHSADDAFAFLTELRRTLRWLNVCDGNMEEGSMRCDANISIRIKGETNLGKRVEVKNLNSIRNVKKAIELEFERLVDLTENNKVITQETRSYDADKNITFSLRSKEDADDYRYFPEPDLPPFIITEKNLEDITANMPDLPASLIEKYTNKYSLSEYDAEIICSDKNESEFFEKLIAKSNKYKACANWMLGPIRQYCNDNNIDIVHFPLLPQSIAELIELTERGAISFSNASKKIMPYLIKNPSVSPNDASIALNLQQEGDEYAVSQWIDEVLQAMPEKVKEYKSGKKGLIGLFSGEVKKLSKGKADMQLVTKILQEKLSQ